MDMSMSADALVAFLVNQPTAIGRLLAEHVDDGRGHCRTCTVGGQQGFLAWPCTLYTAASNAARARKARTPPPQNGQPPRGDG
jgi:hypothetical protein